MADIAAQVSASLDALTREFDIVAHNLANVNTVGYKRRCNAFSQAVDAQAEVGDDEGSEGTASEASFDFSQGHLVATGRKLDLALRSDGFFVIETPDGPLYTRHGIFATNQNGQITDLSGRMLAGIAGPLVVPADVSEMEVHVAADGRVSARGANIGQIRVVEFADEQDQLVPAGSSCFAAPEDVEPTDMLTPVVKQGYQEASNVRLIDELVSMIVVSRLYEANMKLVSKKGDTTNSLLSVAMG